MPVEEVKGTGAMLNNPQRRLSWPARCYLWATHRLYNEFAWAYDVTSWLVSLGRWSHWRELALEQVRGPRVLEIGFGTGNLLLEMARRGWQVCGLDLSPAMQRVTARKMRRHGLWAPRLRGYSQALPFAAGSFDAIIATFPAEYILSPATWHEAARVLRAPDSANGAPGGRFVVAGLYVEGDNTLLRSAARFLPGRPPQRAEATIERLAAAAGFQFTVVREEGKRLRSPVFVMERCEDTD